MKREKAMIGKVTLPDALKTDILFRAFNETELKSIWDSYENAKYKSNRASAPTERQLKLAKLVQEGTSMREVAAKFKLTTTQVGYATRRVALYEYLNK